MRKPDFSSLRSKATLTVISAFLVGVAVFTALLVAGDAIVDKTEGNTAAARVRETRVIASLSEYITANGARTSEPSVLKKWCREHNATVVYANINDTTVSVNADSVTYYDDKDILSDINLYTVRFADATVRTSVFSNRISYGYDISLAISLLVSIILFLFIILSFIRRLIRRIRVLSDELRNPSRTVSVSGNDELSLLAEDAEKMRRSIINHYEAEQHALRSSSELLTSISHDIRTPLTSIIGYSELMADGQAEGIDEMTGYARICRDKAYQLKELTDTLFRYFLIYGNTEVKPQPKPYDARSLTDRLLTEQIEFLRSRGFEVSYNNTLTDCTLTTDIILFKRLLDNIFSNILRYARKNGVIVAVSSENDTVRLVFENPVDVSAFVSDSTGIGLKTCKRICELLGAEMSASRSYERFTFELILTVDKGENNASNE